MSKRIDFVNRKSELKKLKQFAEKKNTILVVLEGSGGIGKSRLSEEFQKRIEEQNDYYSFQCIDFDEDELSGSEDLILRLMTFVTNEEQRVEIRRELINYYAMQRMGDSRLAQENQERVVYQKLAEGLNAVAPKQRKVFFLDTAEKSDESVRQAFAELIVYLDNFYIVVASRPSEPDDPNTRDESFFSDMHRYSKVQVEKIPLEPLSIEQSLTFLKTQAKVLGTIIPEAILERLADMTGGKPVLLALSVDFVRAEVDFPEILKEGDKPAKEDLEKALVKNIQKIKDDIDRLFLLLSRVYPLSSKDIAYFLGVSETRAQEIFDKAKEYTVIKWLPSDKITLHDEMRRLVRIHVWPDYDHSEDRRKRDSRLAATYLKERDDDLRDERKAITPKLVNLPENSPEYFELAIQQIRLFKLRESTTEQWLFHALYANLEDGWKEWAEVIKRIQRGNKHTLVSRLCRLVDRYFVGTNDWLALGREVDFDFRMIKARANVRLGVLEDADKALNVLYHDYGNESGRLATLRNLQGLLETNRANYEQAKKYQQECLELTPQENLSGRAGILTQLGYISRMLEDYQGAENYYEQAMVLADEISNVVSSEEARKANYALIANLQTNLGYICGVLRRYDEAQTYLDLARESWNLAERERELALPDTTEAIIERDRGQLHAAAQRLRRAIDILKYPDDHRHLCQAHFHLGWTLWFIATTIEKDEQDTLKILLKEAIDAFEEALKIAVKHDNWSKIPGIYHQLASTYWTYGILFKDEKRKQEARDLNQQAIKASEQYKDRRYLVDSWAGDIEFDLDERIRDNLPLHQQRFNDIVDKYSSMDLYRGRFLRMFGDFAYQDKKYEEAFKYYAEGIPYINKHGGYGHYSIESELRKIHQRIFALEKSEAKTWLEYLRREWESSPYYKSTHKDLGLWCELQLRQNQNRR